MNMIRNILVLLSVIMIVLSNSFVYAEDADDTAGEEEQLDEASMDDDWGDFDDWDDDFDDWDDDFEDMDDDFEDDMDDDFEDDMDEDVEQEGWGFSSDDEKEEVEVEKNEATFEIPTVVDGHGDRVQSYIIEYSTEDIHDDEIYNEIDVADIEDDEVTGKDGDSFEYTFEDLAEGEEYFVIVTPTVDGNDSENILKFTFETDEEEVHEAATVQIQDVDYEVVDGEVRVTWSPSDDAEKVRVDLRHEDDTDFEEVDYANMDYGEFTIVPTRGGDYTVRLTPVNEVDGEYESAGDEYEFDVTGVETDEAQVEGEAEVGPATNIIIALILMTFIGYVLYRYNYLRN
ncbi:fibronectin type III domain-containing protein [Candidatus Absconditicoccus praedator]|uniref:fibronectin type III domain-containing protein n=1 Tax=Candidatus Absconditicoccus praedator TaxID=2735562 RepID=UPI001E30D3CB|nr:fibronectin type III domain-containing protein [Candidatus Absconditicoccus praedator]